MVYRVGVRPGQYIEQLAGVFMSGSREEVAHALDKLRADLACVERLQWGRLQSVEGRVDRWFAYLCGRVAKSTQSGPVVGWLEMDGARVRVVLIVEGGER